MSSETLTVEIVTYDEHDNIFYHRREEWPVGPRGRCCLPTVIGPDGDAYEILYGRVRTDQDLRDMLGFNGYSDGEGVRVVRTGA